MRQGAWSQTDPVPFVRDVKARPLSHVRIGDAEYPYDGTTEGLLAAIDEACPEEAKLGQHPDQRPSEERAEHLECEVDR